MVLAPLVIMCFIKEKGLLANQAEKKGCVEVLRETFGSQYKVRERRADFLNLEITHLVLEGGLTLCMPDNTILVKCLGNVSRTDSPQIWHPTTWNTSENLVQTGFTLIRMKSKRLCWSMGCLAATPEQVKSRIRELCIFVSRDDDISSPAQWAVSCICCVDVMPPWRQRRSRAITEGLLGNHSISFDDFMKEI